MRCGAFLLFCACSASVPADLTLVLPTDDPTFTSAIHELSLSAYSLDGRRLLATTTIDPGKLATAKPQLNLRVDDQVRVLVRAFDTAHAVIGAGETRLTVQASQPTALTVFVGRVGAFSPHPRATPIARQHASTISDSAGRIWIIGGSVAGTASPAVEVYDPLTLTFTSVASLATAVISPSLGRVAPDGHEFIVVAGGQLQNGEATDAVQVLDPAAKSLAQAQHLATGARAAAAVFEPGDDRLVLLGGFGPRGDEGATGTTLFVDRAASVVTDSRAGPGLAPIALAPPRSGAQLFKLGDDWLLAGGSTSASVGRFDPTTGQTAALASSAFERQAAPCVAASATTIFFACGGTGTLERFVAGTSTIEIVAQVSGQSRDAAQMTMLPDGRLLLAGGSLEGVTTTSNLIYSFGPTTVVNDLSFVGARLGHRLVWTSTRTLLALGGGLPTAEILVFDGP